KSPPHIRESENLTDYRLTPHHVETNVPDVRPAAGLPGSNAVNPTRDELRHHMTRHELPERQANFLVPPTALAGLTGVQSAKQDRAGRITLTYTDGTTEAADCPDFELSECENFFSAIDAVQSHR